MQKKVPGGGRGRDRPARAGQLKAHLTQFCAAATGNMWGQGKAARLPAIAETHINVFYVDCCCRKFKLLICRSRLSLCHSHSLLQFILGRPPASRNCNFALPPPGHKRPVSHLKCTQNFPTGGRGRIICCTRQ